VSIYKKDKYTIWIGRQKIISIPTNKIQMYEIEDPEKYHWVYT